MGKKHDHIMQELAQLGMRVESLERLVDAMRPTDDAPPKWAWVSAADHTRYTSSPHQCEFTPPGFLVSTEDVPLCWPPKPDVWRLNISGYFVKPRINFCPYCGLKLCEPEVP